MGSNNLPSTRVRPAKKIKITKEILDTIIDKHKNKTKISFQQMSILLPNKKKKNSLILNGFFAKKKAFN